LKSLPKHQRGIVHLLPLEVIFVLLVLGVLGYFVWNGTIKLPGGLFQKGAQVELQEKYSNPFKKETQFVNPFDSYKNPFTVNR